MTNCSVRTHFNKVIKNLFSLATDEVAENLPFPDGKEISSTDRDWQYTTTGKPINPFKGIVHFGINV